MARLPSVVVVPDTNVLFTPDKTDFPGARLIEAEAGWRDVAAVQIHVPEIVLWELQYQYVAAARVIAEGLQSKSTTLSRIIASPLPDQMPRDRIRPLVETRLEKWLADGGMELLPLPVRDIAWDKVVHRAVWQEPPFSRTNETRDGEKGFKDCLLLETVKHHLDRLRGLGAVSFVSNDQLLRETISSELGEGSRIRCFDSFDALVSVLRLQYESTTKQLADAVLEPARKAFYDASSRAGLFFSADVPKLLSTKFDQHFQDPTLSEGGLSKYLTPRRRRKGTLEIEWQPAADGLWHVEEPVFVDLAAPERLRWSTNLAFYRLYSRRPWTGFTGYFSRAIPSPPPEPDYRYLFLPFTVTWLATLAGDGTLSDLEVETLKMGEGRFEEPLDDDETPSGGA